MDINISPGTNRYKEYYKKCRNCEGSGYVKSIVYQEGCTVQKYETMISCHKCSGTGRIRIGFVED